MSCGQSQVPPSRACSSSRFLDHLTHPLHFLPTSHALAWHALQRLGASDTDQNLRAGETRLPVARNAARPPGFGCLPDSR